MTNIQIEKAHPQQVGIREVKKKMEKDIYQPLFIAFTMGVQKGQNAGGGRLSSFNS